MRSARPTGIVDPVIVVPRVSQRVGCARKELLRKTIRADLQREQSISCGHEARGNQRVPDDRQQHEAGKPGS